MDEDLELEEPARVPDTQAYCIDGLDQEQDQAAKDIPPISHEQALEHLLNIQKSNLDNTKLFDLLEQAVNHLQCKKTVTKITSKNVQPSLFKFFQKS